MACHSAPAYSAGRKSVRGGGAEARRGEGNKKGRRERERLIAKDKVEEGSVEEAKRTAV